MGEPALLMAILVNSVINMTVPFTTTILKPHTSSERALYNQLFRLFSPYQPTCLLKRITACCLFPKEELKNRFWSSSASQLHRLLFNPV